MRFKFRLCTPHFTSSLLNVGSFSRLREVNLSGNSLRAIPEFLDKLPLLRTIRIASNQISSIPSWLSKLETLDLSSNMIKDSIQPLLTENHTLRSLKYSLCSVFSLSLSLSLSLSVVAKSFFSTAFQTTKEETIQGTEALSSSMRSKLLFATEITPWSPFGMLFSILFSTNPSDVFSLVD